MFRCCFAAQECDAALFLFEKLFDSFQFILSRTKADLFRLIKGCLPFNIRVGIFEMIVVAVPSRLCKVLANAGAIVTGYSLNPPTSPSLFEIADIAQDVHSVIGDIRDYATLKAAFDAAQPEIVLHLAAQPIVRDSYKNPAYTYETNVMGTVNILECVRKSNCVKSFLNVTTDKVYLNKEWAWGYRENEELDGFDPYSNSKSCSELVTHSYKNSFFADGRVAISTARAGNVIGGGDFANDRIIPDCIRAAMKQEPWFPSACTCRDPDR